MMIADFLRNLNTVANQIQVSEEQVTSGKKINKPSDGPVEATQILSYQFASGRLAKYLKNIDDGTSQVNFVDSTLQAINGDLSQAHDVSLNAANASLTSDDRIAAGGTIDQLLSSTLSNANTQYQDRYLFAGYKTQTQPFQTVINSRTGLVEDVIYKGDSGAINRQVADQDQFGD